MKTWIMRLKIQPLLPWKVAPLACQPCGEYWLNVNHSTSNQSCSLLFSNNTKIPSFSLKDFGHHKASWPLHFSSFSSHFHSTLIQSSSFNKVPSIKNSKSSKISTKGGRDSISFLCSWLWELVGVFIFSSLEVVFGCIWWLLASLMAVCLCLN